MQNILCGAIKNHQVVEFYYDGGSRIAEPHMVAYNEKDDLSLSAWFLRGHSSSCEGAGWREYILDDISSLNVLSETFIASRPGYKPDGGQKFHNVQCGL